MVHTFQMPCMVNGKCSKHFPKQFNSESHYVQNSNYAEYRRREFDDDGNKSTPANDVTSANRPAAHSITDGLCLMLLVRSFNSWIATE